MTTVVRSGIDRIMSGDVTLPQQRYGLVTAAHARTLDGTAGRKALAGRIELTGLFSPEHGLEGVAMAGDKVSSDTDRMTGLPVHSLYQTQGEQELLPPEVLDTLDAFIYDLPDVGTRFYTYISTCLQILDAAAKHGKAVYILDRPNPLGGEVIEGLTQQEKDFSFVGAYTLPIRYGLTVGELAKLYVSEQNLDIKLEVIACEGWTRSQYHPDTGQVFMIPSPNIPNWQTAVLYPGTCLIEGTNLSEGRGTARPFTWFGAPWIDQEELCEALNTLDHPGIAIRPQGYIPTYSKNKDQHCQGVALEITDHHAVRSVRFMVEAIAKVKELYPKDFAFINPWTEGGVSFIERLMGQDFVAASWKTEGFAAKEQADREVYLARVKPYLIYE